MPINVGYFRVRQPRVSSNNAITTTAPTASGNFSLLDGFQITYTGSATKCYLYITGTKILTLCDEDHLHSDNLIISLVGITIGDVVSQIKSHISYRVVTLTTRLNDFTFVSGLDKFDLKASSYIVKYNNQKEYTVEVNTRGDIGFAKINTKTENFTFKGEINRWDLNEGEIHDQVGVTIPLNGEVEVGTEGVNLKFKPSYRDSSIDLENIVNFNNTELIRNLNQPLSTSIFPPAPISIEGTLQVFVNQNESLEGRDFIIDYGERPAITAILPQPYVVATTSLLKVRWNSDPVQTFTLSPGSYTASQVSNLINLTSHNFKSLVHTNEQNQKFLVLAGNKGTIYHQLRVEDGDANYFFGFENFQAKKGSGVGQIHFLSYIDSENVSPENVTDSVTVSAIQTATDNPFLGIETSNFNLKENSLVKVQGQDYLVDGAGTINFISKIEEESLLDYILQKDDNLFEPSFTIYEDATPLLEGRDYSIYPQGGWITLEKSAFPDRVYSASYTSSFIGKIEKEILLGSKASLLGTADESYSINSDNNTFVVSISGESEQIFKLANNTTTTATSIAIQINATAVGFKCFVCEKKIELMSNEVGPKTTIRIGEGTANVVLGFTAGQGSNGKGAEGGEQSLSVKNAPMETLGFTAPIYGDTIIIKNKDVRSRYPAGAIISIIDDYYEVKDSSIEERANLINTVTGPFTIIADYNDNFKFIVNSETEKTVTLKVGSEVTVATIVNQINAVRPFTARVLKINGLDRIQLLGSSSIKVGYGNSNRVLGFDDASEDTSTSDTFIKIMGYFKSTYSSPDMYTTSTPISFVEENIPKLEAPQLSSTIFFVGNYTSKFRSNTLIRITGNFYYKVLFSNYADGLTEVTLNSKLGSAVFEDTQISYSLLPVYVSGHTNLMAKNNLFLSEPFVIKRNGIILNPDIDYTVFETGSIELIQGVSFGEELLLDYTARRYLPEGTSVLVSYSYFDYLKIGSSVQYSVQAINPDNFYINVLHGSTILGRASDELSERTLSNLGSGASGFPSGSIPSVANDASGVGNFNYTLGDLDNKIEIAQKIFEYYDRRILSFEDERKSLNGWIVGADKGRVSLQEILDSALLNAPQRLFPIPDTRPLEQRTEPVRVPALDGWNRNDLGSSASGIYETYQQQKLLLEKAQLNNEKDNLNLLKTLSVSFSSISSRGSYASLVGNEHIVLYVEAKSGSDLLQANVTVVMPGIVSGTDFSGNNYTIYPNASDVASRINSAINKAFGITLNPATATVSSHVTLTATTSPSDVQCIYIVQDDPKINFGVGNQASIRSRNALYTGNSSYSMNVPGLNSVHIDINNHKESRLSEDALHAEQLNSLDVQMEEWLSSYQQSFTEAKSEKIKIDTALKESLLFTSLSNSFSNLKFYNGIFNSIDSENVINARIAELDNRIAQLNRRYDEVTARLIAIESSLSRENLYNPRFSWLTLLADKSIGFFASKNREITDELRKQRGTSNNLEAVLSLKSLF